MGDGPLTTTWGVFSRRDVFCQGGGDGSFCCSSFPLLVGFSYWEAVLVGVLNGGYAFVLLLLFLHSFVVYDVPFLTRPTQERTAKRSTLTWADFSSTGFTRTDALLTDTLQFSAPLSATITQWPNAEKDLQRKLRKQQKNLPAFGWDTAPVMDGREEVVEEGFVDVFCDLLYGGGWMDRAEGTFRECNWALVGLLFSSLRNNGMWDGFADKSG